MLGPARAKSLKYGGAKKFNIWKLNEIRDFGNKIYDFRSKIRDFRGLNLGCPKQNPGFSKQNPTCSKQNTQNRTPKLRTKKNVQNRTPKLRKTNINSNNRNLKFKNFKNVNFMCKKIIKVDHVYYVFLYLLYTLLQWESEKTKNNCTRTRRLWRTKMLTKWTFIKPNDESTTQICIKKRGESRQNSGIGWLSAQMLVYKRFFGQVGGQISIDFHLHYCSCCWCFCYQYQC